MNIFNIPRGREKTTFAGYSSEEDKVALAICLTKGTEVVVGGDSVGQVLEFIIIDRVEFIEWIHQMDTWAKSLTEVT